MNSWYSSQIISGDQTGSKYVYPTINLMSDVLPADTKRGVYASLVRLGDQEYQGALFYGPRLVKDETNDVLEIYLLDFTGEINDTEVSFQLVRFLREVKDFSSLSELKKQVTEDIKQVRKALA